MRVRDLVAVQYDGKVEVHLPPADGSGYATLCNLDGGEDLQEGMEADAFDGSQRIVRLPRPARVTCTTCTAIWRLARSVPPSLIG